MKVISDIAKHLKGNAGKYLAKGVGVATLGMVAQDAHSIAKMQGDMYAMEKDAYYASYYLNNKLYNSSMSNVTDKVKNSAYNMELDQTWRRFFNSGIGYVQGFCSMLTNHVVPFGLGLGALLTKGLAAKICAGGAIAYGAFKLVKNFFGIGVPNGPLD